MDPRDGVFTHMLNIVQVGEGRHRWAYVPAALTFRVSKTVAKVNSNYSSSACNKLDEALMQCGFRDQPLRVCSSQCMPCLICPRERTALAP